MIRIYAHNDLDGQMSASILWKYYNLDDNIDIKLLNYTKNDFSNLNDIVNGDKIWIVDYSLNNEQLKRLEFISSKANIIWIDHHASSVVNKNKFDGVISTKYCGAVLTWQYLYAENENDELPYFLKLVNDHDLWLLKQRYSESFNCGMCIGHKFENGIYTNIRNCVTSYFSSNEWHDSFVQNIINSGNSILSYINERNNKRSSDIYISEFDGYKCLVVNEYINSTIFDKCNKKDIDICVVWTYKKDGMYKYSLYSDTVDVSKICLKYGGGGHKGAGGFMYDSLLFKPCCNINNER